MYAIAGTVFTREPDGSEGTVQTPIFYLNENVQGIVDEAHAEKIAREIIDPLGLLGEDLIVGAVKI